MTERQAKTHFLENTDLSSILEPETSSSRPAECKGMLLPSWMSTPHLHISSVSCSLTAPQSARGASWPVPVYTRCGALLYVLLL